MQLLLRKVAVLLIAAGLVLSGATSHAGMIMPTAGDDAAAAHTLHQVEKYADLAIEPGDADCTHVSDRSGGTPVQQPQDNGLCKKCCAACAAVSLMPEGAAPVFPISHEHDTYRLLRRVLVAQTIPIDPGIPKTL